MDHEAASALAAENAALRAKNDADARKLRQLEVLLASIGRDMGRLCIPFGQVQSRDQRQVKRHMLQLEAKHAQLSQQNRELIAAARKGGQPDAISFAGAGGNRQQGYADSSRQGDTAAAAYSDEEMLSHPATVRMLDALLEKEDTVAALRKDVAKMQSSLHELDPQRLAVSMGALRRELELVEAQEALRRAETEQVYHRMTSLKASGAQLVERAAALRREKLNMSYIGNGFLEKVYTLLQTERDELTESIADLFQHNQQMALLAEEQSRWQLTAKEQIGRLIHRHRLLRSHTEGLRSLLGAYIKKRAGLREVEFDMEERIKAIKYDTEKLQTANDKLRATNAAATTLLGLLNMQQREQGNYTDLDPIPPELMTKDGRDVSQLLGSVRTVEAAIVEAGGERAWEDMAEVLWRVRQQIGEKLMPPAQILRTEIALVEIEIANTKELLEQQQSLGDVLVNKRAAATADVTELLESSLALAASVSELEALDRRCQQLGEIQRALDADPGSWRKTRDSLRQEQRRRSTK